MRKKIVAGNWKMNLVSEEANALFDEISSNLSGSDEPLVLVFPPLEIREKKEEMEYVKKQLENSLFHLSVADISKCVIAYEPVWAIGTGKTASIEQAEEMHFAIRSWLGGKYGQQVADAISILYGGSCTAANAKELFSCPNVDGGLIGGAALDADAFLQIIHSY